MVQTELDHLPEELLSLIPKDPYDQLDLAHKITSIAIASHVSKLQSDVELIQQQLNDKDQLIYKLEEKAAWLERAYREADLQFKSTIDQNIRLSIERDSLSSTVKRLTHDITKLETLKRQLKQSLNYDNNSSSINAAQDTLNDLIGSTANSSSTSSSIPPRINGKDFFRQARNRLSREQFTTFLANINARRQTREETLKKAEEILGTQNTDLYLSFHALLNRSSTGV